MSSSTGPAHGADDALPATRIAPSAIHGNGVFATRLIPKGQIIERCPCIILEPGWQRVETVLHDYLYCWPKEGDGRAIVLGQGSVFNHDAKPNADWVTDEAARQCVYHALRDIQLGEEILINYGEEYWSTEHAGADNPYRLPLGQLISIFETNILLH